jgi:hypothetical protein
MDQGEKNKQGPQDNVEDYGQCRTGKAVENKVGHKAQQDPLKEKISVMGFREDSRIPCAHRGHIMIFRSEMGDFNVRSRFRQRKGFTAIESRNTVPNSPDLPALLDGRAL